jgi:hypothetical protein
MEEWYGASDLFFGSFPQNPNNQTLDDISTCNWTLTINQL